MEVLDDPSGILSWEAFATFGKYVAAQTKRREAALSLLVLALDTSPGLTTSAGVHLEEAAVRIISGVLLRTIRSGDFAGRHGPSSFAVIAQDAQRAGAQRLAERIQAALPTILSAFDQVEPFSVSIGIATQPQSGTTLPDLLRNAEQAVGEAISAGGGRSQMSSSVNALGDGDTGRLLRRTVEAFEREQLSRLPVQRRDSLADATRAFERGEVEGIVVKTQSGACAVCLDTARDVFQPRWAPALPLIGCSTPGGCRCIYSTPQIDPHKRPPPVKPVSYAGLGVPGVLKDAAFFGSDPKLTCRVEDLAEYLDRYPLLPFASALPLQSGEVAYLQRPARRATEERTRAAGVAAHGALFPLTRPFSSWVHQIEKPSSAPGEALTNREEGMLYLTNWRLHFKTATNIRSTLLADITGVEYLRDGIAYVDGGQRNRVFLLVKEPLLIGFCLVRALRDIAALGR